MARDLKSRLSDMLSKAYESGPLAESAERMKTGLKALPPEPESTPPTISSQKIPSVQPSDRLIAKPADRQTVRPSDGRTVIHTDSLTDIPSNTQTVSPSNVQTIRPSNHQTVREYQTIPQTPLHFIPREVLNLAYNQACVLENLINNHNGITNYRSISEQTHVGIPSVREAMSRLVTKGFILKPVTVKNAAFQGFSFVLNKALCDHFLLAGGLSQQNYQTNYQTVRVSDSQTVEPLNSLTLHSSSCLESKATTTTEPSDGQRTAQSDRQTYIPSDISTIKPSDSFILTGAVGAYWQEEGLGEGQAQKWCEQFEVDAGQMKRQLDWARFDLEYNNRRSEVKKDSVSWFFGHLRTTGGSFPRPQNYRSPVELRAEQLRQDREAQEKAEAEIEMFEKLAKFDEVLKNPDGKEYKQLLMGLSEFERNGSDRVLKAGLKRVWEENNAG